MNASDPGAWTALGHALQTLIACVFFAAAITKARHPHRFVTLVTDYGIGPPALMRPVAGGVVLLEFCVAVSLLTGILVQVGLTLATIALVVFALAVTVTLRRGRRIACGCFGDAETVSGRSLARILLLLSGTLVVLAFDSLDRQPISAVWVMHHGAAGVLYVLQIGLVAGSMMLIASWLLRISQVISVIRTSAENAE